MTIDEKIEKLADGLNQTLIILETLAYNTTTRYGIDLSSLRQDLLKERNRVAEVIKDYDK